MLNPAGWKRRIQTHNLACGHWHLQCRQNIPFSYADRTWWSHEEFSLHRPLFVLPAVPPHTHQIHSVVGPTIMTLSSQPKEDVVWDFALMTRLVSDQKTVAIFVTDRSRSRARGPWHSPCPSHPFPSFSLSLHTPRLPFSYPTSLPHHLPSSSPALPLVQLGLGKAVSISDHFDAWKHIRWQQI